MKLLYIGRAGVLGLRKHISAHQEDNFRTEWENRLSRNTIYFLYRSTKTDQAARELEQKELETYKPRYNNYQKESDR